MCIFKAENKRSGRKKNLVMHKMFCWKQKVFFSFKANLDFNLYSSPPAWTQIIVLCSNRLGGKAEPHILQQQPKPKEGSDVDTWTPRTQGLGMATLGAPSQAHLQSSIRLLMFSQSLGKQSQNCQDCFACAQHSCGPSSLWKSKAQPCFQKQEMKAPCELEPCNKPGASISIFGW